MISPNDINTRAQEIQDLLAQNEILHAAKRLMDFVRDFSEIKGHLKEVIAINATATRLRTNERMNMLSFNELTRSYNLLIFQILELVDIIQEDLAIKNSLI